MKITFVLPKFFDFPIGGYRIVYQHANALAERGHKVTVILPRGINRQSLSFSDRMKNLAWPFLVRARQRPLVRWQAINPAVRLKLISNLLPAHLPDGDALIATSWGTTPLVAAADINCGRKFYLLQDYEVWGNVTQEQVDATFGLPLTVLAISNWLADLAEEKGAGRVMYVPNAIDHSVFRVKDQPPREREASILALHHQDARKDIPTLLKALSAVHVERPLTPIALFGTASRPADLPDWISYHERPTAETLATIYNTASIFVSSSIKEGWALPPLEAMACGCAFVGTDSCGPRDYATDGHSALFSKPGDAEQLAANVLRVVDDLPLRHLLQERGRLQSQNFTWDRSRNVMEAALLNEGGMPG